MTSEISEGARLLIRAGSIAAVAKSLAVTERAISRYRAGRRPSDELQQRLLVIYGIPLESWTRSVGTATSVATTRLELPTADADADADEPEAATTGQPGASADAVGLIRAQLTRLQGLREAGGLTAKAAVDLEAVELRCSSQLARLTTHAVTEKMIVASRPWLEIGQRVVRMLGEADPLGMLVFWRAVGPSDEPTIAAEADAAIVRLRVDHPDEVAACESANAALLEAMRARPKSPS